MLYELHKPCMLQGIFKISTTSMKVVETVEMIRSETTTHACLKFKILLGLGDPILPELSDQLAQSQWVCRDSPNRHLRNAPP